MSEDFKKKVSEFNSKIFSECLECRKMAFDEKGNLKPRGWLLFCSRHKKECANFIADNCFSITMEINGKKVYSKLLGEIKRDGESQ